ncbi:hypothetical protein ACLB2K_076775 [Fragaria x ananassa]
MCKTRCPLIRTHPKISGRFGFSIRKPSPAPTRRDFAGIFWVGGSERKKSLYINYPLSLDLLLHRSNNFLFIQTTDQILRSKSTDIGEGHTLVTNRMGHPKKLPKLRWEIIKELEINKTGKFILNIENKDLFSKAEVGDWVNYFTPEMEERMSKLIEEKFGGSGLTFKWIPERADSVQQN